MRQLIGFFGWPGGQLAGRGTRAAAGNACDQSLKGTEMRGSLIITGCGGICSLLGATAGSLLSVPDLAIPIFASAGAIAGAAAGLLVWFTR